uniref:Uncharacterized protein n=1 Tax=Trichogramma kaykai TaxID=54128 RepID=A0ABD2XSS8_9HYME
MDYIIDLQGYICPESGFLPKEIGIVSLMRHSASSWVIAPPHHYHTENAQGDDITSEASAVDNEDGDDDDDGEYNIGANNIYSHFTNKRTNVALNTASNRQ